MRGHTEDSYNTHLNGHEQVGISGSKRKNSENQALNELLHKTHARVAGRFIARGFYDANNLRFVHHHGAPLLREHQGRGRGRGRRRQKRNRALRLFLVFLPRAQRGHRGEPVPVGLKDVVQGEPFVERLLLTAGHDEESLGAMLQSLCNDLRAPSDYALQRRLLVSVQSQVQRHCDIEVLDKVKRLKSVEAEAEAACHGHVALRLSVSHGKRIGAQVVREHLPATVRAQPARAAELRRDGAASDDRILSLPAVRAQRVHPRLQRSRQRHKEDRLKM